MTKTKTPLIDFILPFYIGDDHLRPAMMQVSKEGDYLCATNANIAIRIPAKYAVREYSKIEKYPDLNRVFDNYFKELKPKNETKTVRTIDLVNDVVNIEGIYATIINPSTNCEKCKGDGIEKCICCNHESNCNSCDGSGNQTDFDKIGHRVTINLIEDDSFEHHIKLGNGFIRPVLLNSVLQALTILRIDEFSLTAIDNAFLFEVPEYEIEILLMAYKK